ncbi:MAG: hypothetical protein FJ217_03575 [Ignavibacteria bacterium]|nr:hypothetical protein [Ignavibacteria bacterium]
MTVLFVVITIVVFLAIDAVVRAVRARRGIQPAVAVAGRQLRTYPVRIPDGIFFARSHTWLTLFPSGKVRLGLDDFVGRLLENPDVCYLKAVGDSVKKGEPILQVKEGDRSLTIRAPMDGEILARNDAMRRLPGLLKEMLFTDGWAYTMRPDRPSDLTKMLLGHETRTWIADEFRRLRDLFAGGGRNPDLVPALLQDGGAPVAGALKQMDQEVWRRFEQEFLEIE